MPKMKTHRGAAKRFSKTGTGKIKRNHAYKRHILESKSPGRKRGLRKAALVASGDVKRIKSLLVYVK
ncbi:50S ribosomal protein L35 [Paenibacillus sp. J31TS4]|uniref:50S ribosomal protein L35 n=1 Tax=Paenibacillus sp. J31TS4 TaxID=2807195 RepID=UPI001B1CACAD|nr:50S ribosomal protein L35 [Paenibacillus sp. J31TS4]GIP38887.1 50S ribosomal protein L35 [Paenibacillus sp. J31TS4]